LSIIYYKKNKRKIAIKRYEAKTIEIKQNLKPELVVSELGCM